MNQITNKKNPRGRALILDMEWGKINIGLILVSYDPRSGEPGRELDRYECVGVNKSDAKRIRALLAETQVIIAHSNGNDKQFFRLEFPSSKFKPWLCSRYGVPWEDYGFPRTELGDLCERSGIDCRKRHDALSDAESLLALLSKKRGKIVTYFTTKRASGSYFAELLNSEYPEA